MKIPDGVWKIGPRAFARCKPRRVIIPGGVRVIGEYAFGMEHLGLMNGWVKCNAPESVVIAEGVEEIQQAAFSHCCRLREIQLPSSLKRIGMEAFSYTGLCGIKIPEGITEIERAAFKLCTDLKTVELPHSLKRIGEDAFQYSGITEITIPNGIEEIGAGAFSDCDALRSARIPVSVEQIGDFAFFGCKRLTDVTQTAAVLRACEEEYSPFRGTPFGDHRFQEAQTRRWQRQGLCAHCGGEFTGLIFKECICCHEPKDY